jgi:hypothetical protein
MKLALTFVVAHLALALFLFALATPLPPEECEWCKSHRTLLLCIDCRTHHCEGCYHAWHATKPPFNLERTLEGAILDLRTLAQHALD